MSEPGLGEPRLTALMLASLDGDASAYRHLLAGLSVILRRYFQRRLSDTGHVGADDLVQDVLMAIHAKRATYDRVTPVSAWAFAIARYKLADHFRRRRIRAELPIDEDLDLFTAADDAEPAMARRDVKVALDSLPDRTSLLIRRVRIDGESVAEAAASVGMTETAAKVSIHRGLRALVARFGGADNDR